MKQYITYGFTIEDLNTIETNLSNVRNKPKSALWGSPTDAEFGWKQWCESEQWIPGSSDPEEYFATWFKWTLAERSNIYTIFGLDDLKKLDDEGFIDWSSDRYATFLLDSNSKGSPKINFFKLRDAGYTAVELVDFYLGHYFIDDLEMSMNCWDCQSIVVLDPTKIILLERSSNV